MELFILSALCIIFALLVIYCVRGTDPIIVDTLNTIDDKFNSFISNGEADKYTLLLHEATAYNTINTNIIDSISKNMSLRDCKYVCLSYMYANKRVPEHVSDTILLQYPVNNIRIHKPIRIYDCLVIWFVLHKYSNTVSADDIRFIYSNIELLYKCVIYDDNSFIYKGKSDILAYPGIIESLYVLLYDIGADVEDHFAVYAKLFVEETSSCLVTNGYGIDHKCIISNIICRKYLSSIYNISMYDFAYSILDYLPVEECVLPIKTRARKSMRVQNHVLKKIQGTMRVRDIVVVCPTHTAYKNKYAIVVQNAYDIIGNNKFYIETLLYDNFNIYPLCGIGQINGIQLPNNVFLITKFVESLDVNLNSFVFVEDYSFKCTTYIKHNCVNAIKFFVVYSVSSDIKLDITILELNRKYFINGNMVQCYSHDVHIKHIENSIHTYVFYVNLYQLSVDAIEFGLGTMISDIDCYDIKNIYNDEQFKLKMKDVEYANRYYALDEDVLSIASK